MDPTSVVRTLWRHKILTMVLVVSTLLGVRHVIVLPFSEFDARAAVLLVPPRRAPVQPPPVDAAAPVKDNPYLRDYSAPVVISVVSSSVNSESMRRRLVAMGADPRYAVLPPSKYGYNGAIAEMRATGPTAAVAQRTAQLVLAAFQERLQEIQAVEDIDARSFIRTRVVRAPAPGIPVVPGRARAVAGVLGLGAIGLFTLVSTVDFVERARGSAVRRRVALSGRGR